MYSSEYVVFCAENLTDAGAVGDNACVAGASGAARASLAIDGRPLAEEHTQSHSIPWYGHAIENRGCRAEVVVWVPNSQVRPALRNGCRP